MTRERADDRARRPGHHEPLRARRERRVDRAIRVSTAAVVLAVAGIAAYISYWHAYAVVREYGETGVTARLEPATIDGLVYASCRWSSCTRPGTTARSPGWPAGLPGQFLGQSITATDESAGISEQVTGLIRPTCPCSQATPAGRWSARPGR